MAIISAIPTFTAGDIITATAITNNFQQIETQVNANLVSPSFTNTTLTGALGVGTAASATAGEIRATNNITAYYSDARLKTVTGNIQNALASVCALNGVLYISNDLAKSFGYDSTESQVGVLAQEVKAVLPEVVTAAPFDIGQNVDGTEFSKSGENYMTVRYERLVPLLIEAIKELKAEVDLLKNK